MDLPTDEKKDREALLRGLAARLGRDKRSLLDSLPTPELLYLTMRWDLWARYADYRRGRWLLEWEMSAIERGRRALVEIEACAAVDWPTAEVLDVGCGDGGFLIAIAQRGARAHGVDVADFNVTGAYLRGQCWHLPIAATVGSASALPYRSGAFDAVTCGDVIEHVARPAAALGEIERVLRPGGLLWLAAPTPWLLPHLWRDPHHGYFGISALSPRLAMWYLVCLRRVLPSRDRYGVERLPTYRTTVRTLRRLRFDVLAGEYGPLRTLRHPERASVPWKRRLLAGARRTGLRGPLAAILTLAAELSHPLRLVCRKPEGGSG